MITFETIKRVAATGDLVSYDTALGMFEVPGNFTVSEWYRTVRGTLELAQRTGGATLVHSAGRAYIVPEGDDYRVKTLPEVQSSTTISELVAYLDGRIQRLLDAEQRFADAKRPMKLTNGQKVELATLREIRSQIDTAS